MQCLIVGDSIYQCVGQIILLSELLPFFFIINRIVCGTDNWISDDKNVGRC